MTMIIRLLVIFTCAALTGTDGILKPNEEEIFAFDTEKGKQVLLAKDKHDKYIVYRFGKGSKIELEFPKGTIDSWKKFTYSYYLRPAQEQAEGMDLNYVYFINGKFKYILYETTVSGEKTVENIGIRVVDVNTGKTLADIKGIKSTRRGSLLGLRDNELITKGDETFD